MGIPVFKWLVYDPNWVLTLSKNYKNLFFYFLYIIASEKDVKEQHIQSKVFLVRSAFLNWFWPNTISSNNKF